MSWFRGRRRMNDPLPVNTEFSVVSGNLVLAANRVVAFNAIVPTVFNGTAFPGEGSGSSPQHSETVWFALQIAQDSHPGCSWQSEQDVDFRPANSAETSWALANGVNERFQ